jgi:hypothetical protein
VHNDIYVESENKPSILAYNFINPWNPPTSTTVGTVMLADKDKGLQVI